MSALTPLDVDSVDESPHAQFERWLLEATGTVRDLDAIALATASADGVPSARMVLLRRRGPEGYGFFTSYESRKAGDLAANPKAALLWFNEALGRQVRIEGCVEVMDAADSDAYFQSRPRAHQISAVASRQSSELASRDELARRVAELTERFAGLDVERPATWGGYLLTPARYEFWQMREDRLHDRVVYEDPPRWRRVRYAP